MNTFKKLLVVGLLAAALGAGQARADLGTPIESGIGETTSSGPVGAGVTIPRLISESGEYSIDFGTYAGTGSLLQIERLKVGLNYGDAAIDGKYTIMATDQGSADGFFVDDVNGVNASIPFIIVARNIARGGDHTIFFLTEGVAQDMEGGFNSLDLPKTTDNLVVGYRLDVADLQAAQAGRYEGFVNFLFAPSPEDPGTP